MADAATAKDPRRVAAGKAGMRARWGPSRVLRLDSLDPITREIVNAIVAARANQKAAPASETSGAATSEGHGNDRPAD